MKEETRPYNKRLAEKQGSAIDLDVGPPLDAKQVCGLIESIDCSFVCKWFESTHSITMM